MDGSPVGGSVRFGTGNSFAPEVAQVGMGGREFSDGQISSYEFIEVSSPGYYTVIMPLADLWETTHFRLHQKPPLLLYAIGGAVGLGVVYWLFRKPNKKRKTKKKINARL